MAKKKQILTESQIDKLYEVKIGFDVESGRYDVGTQVPNFVSEKDFSKEDFKELLAAGAIVAVEHAEPLKEDESIVFEKVED